MKQTFKFLRSLNWRVLLSIPILSALLGVTNNLRVPDDQRVRWAGERPDKKSIIAAKSVAKPGLWTYNFDSATNAAAAAQIPVVVVVVQEGCQFCSRLHNVLEGDVVRSWQKERNWYFVIVSREKDPQTAEFVAMTPATNNVAPYVGVYWTRADGTQTMRNFSGRHGLMGVPSEKSLALEWMHAVEASVADAPGLKGKASAASIINKMKKRIAVAADLEKGAKGKVKMSRQISYIKEGQTVYLMAEPKRGSLFAGWQYPDGQISYNIRRLKVDSKFPEGTYTAIFRLPKNCAAPVLQLPKKEVTWTEWKSEKLVLRVNQDAYPVKFNCSGLPPGTYFSPSRNMICGRPKTNGVWRVEVMSKSASRKLPVATGSFTIRVLPASRPAVDDDNESNEEDDDEEEEE